MRDRVEVRCYADGRGDETPRAVVFAGHGVAVWVAGSWVEEPLGSGGTARRQMLKIRLEDGRHCRLAQEPDGSWTLDPMSVWATPRHAALQRERRGEPW